MASRVSNQTRSVKSLPETGDSRRLRIALVAPGLEILGGQGVQARMLEDGLRKDGHDVVFIRVNPLFPRGLRWLRGVPGIRTVLNQILYVPSLITLWRVDVVHVYSASYWSFLLAPVPAILMSKILRKHVVLNYHSGEADDHLENWGWWVHPFLWLVNEIVVPSEYLRTVFDRHGYHTRVVRNALDVTRFHFVRRVPLRPRLLSTRNLEPHYGIGVIIEAFALVQSYYPEATLTVAGYGSEENRLRAQAASLGVTGVDFCGRVEPEMMPGLFSDADIYLNASVIDNQPISILEAFSAGTPVVSTPTGDIAHIIRDSETGCLVPVNDPAAMAVAVCALLQNPERAAAMARRARDEVEHYTWFEVRKAWHAVYTKVAG